MGLFNDIESDFLDFLAEKKHVTYTDVSVKFNIAPSTSAQYCRRLASKYPDNISYSRGHLILQKPLEIEQVSREGLVKAIRVVQKDRNKKVRAIKKVLRNHFPHLSNNAKKEVGNAEETLKKALKQEED